MLKANKTQVLRRDSVVDATVANGNLIRIQKPKFLSMVGHPANQTAFKTVRSDQTGAPAMPKTILRQRKRSAANPVLRLAFPADTTMDEATAALAEFGLEGYRLEEAGGLICATRADLQSVATEGTLEIKLTGEKSEAGIVATVMAPETKPATLSDKPAVALARMEFDAATFTQEQVDAWCQEHQVDGTLVAPQNSDTSYIVQRSDVGENEETRRLELDTGVVAVLVRADSSNVPAGYAEVISESAYGNWGWGQLDFSAMMADIAFCDVVEDASYRLRRVMDNIIMSSSLPLDTRKELVNNALTQFGAFIGNLLDSLPRQLLVSLVPVARSATHNLEKSMKQDESGAASNGQPTQPVAVTPEAFATLTRNVEELAKLVRGSVTTPSPEGTGTVTTTTPGAPAPASTPAAPSITPPAGTPATTPVPTPAPAPAPADDSVQITRADLKSLLADAMKPVEDLKAEVETIKGTTLVRSAGNAQESTVPPAASTDPAEVKRLARDAVFKGAIGGINIVRQKSQ